MMYIIRDFDKKHIYRIVSNKYEIVNFLLIDKIKINDLLGNTLIEISKKFFDINNYINFNDDEINLSIDKVLKLKLFL